MDWIITTSENNVIDNEYNTTGCEEIILSGHSDSVSRNGVIKNDYWWLDYCKENVSFVVDTKTRWYVCIPQVGRIYNIIS